MLFRKVPKLKKENRIPVVDIEEFEEDSTEFYDDSEYEDSSDPWLTQWLEK